jgi:hypothetical protein
VTFDCDAWRAAYPTATYAEQQAAHSEMYAGYPEQRHFDAGLVASAIERVGPERVVELGGWDGELAERMLDRFDGIASWRNVELCREAAAAGAGRHPRYDADEVGDWYWTREWDCDLFVASHTIEHLSAEHLGLVLDATRAEALFLDAPLADGPTEWAGVSAMHVLEFGWLGVTAMCRRRGYHLVDAVDHLTDPASGGRARGCLYVRR